MLSHCVIQCPVLSFPQFSPDTIPCSYGIDVCLFFNFIFPFTSMQTFLIRKFSMTNLPSLHLCNTQYNIILTFVKQSKSKITLIPWGNSDVVIPPSLLHSTLLFSLLVFFFILSLFFSFIISSIYSLTENTFVNLNSTD